MKRTIHAIALSIAIAITALGLTALQIGMRDGLERAQLDNIEPVRIVITAPRNDGQVAGAPGAATF
jgi:hypothetical protein